jgi:hypothetical protein
VNSGDYDIVCGEDCAPTRASVANCKSTAITYLSVQAAVRVFASSWR